MKYPIVAGLFGALAMMTTPGALAENSVNQSLMTALQQSAPMTVQASYEKSLLARNDRRHDKYQRHYRHNNYHRHHKHYRRYHDDDKRALYYLAPFVLQGLVNSNRDRSYHRVKECRVWHRDRMRCGFVDRRNDLCYVHHRGREVGFSRYRLGCRY